MRIKPFSFVSLLLDPAPGEAQGGNDNPDASDAGQGNEDPPPPPPPEDDEAKRELQTLRDELSKLRSENEQIRGKVSESEAEQLRKRKEAEKAEIEKHRKAGDLEKIEQRYQNQIAEVEKERDAANARIEEFKSKYANNVISLELSQELSKYRIAEGWTSALLRLHSGEFQAIDRGDRFEVQSTDNKTVASKVKEILSRPEYKRIILAENGGQGAGSTRKTEPRPTGDQPTRYETLGHAMLDRYASQFGGRRSVALGGDLAAGN